jgi:hypothetical protein
MYYLMDNSAIKFSQDFAQQKRIFEGISTMSIVSQIDQLGPAPER